MFPMCNEYDTGMSMQYTIHLFSTEEIRLSNITLVQTQTNTYKGIVVSIFLNYFTIHSEISQRLKFNMFYAIRVRATKCSVVQIESSPSRQGYIRPHSKLNSNPHAFQRTEVKYSVTYHQAVFNLQSCIDRSH